MSIYDEQRERKFNDLLLESIGEVLDFSDTILRFLELNSTFSKSSIGKNPELFSEELKELFGDSGKIIENLILRRLYAKLDTKIDTEKGTFKERMNKAFSVYAKQRGG